MATAAELVSRNMKERVAAAGGGFCGLNEDHTAGYRYEAGNSCTKA